MEKNNSKMSLQGNGLLVGSLNIYLHICFLKYDGRTKSRLNVKSNLPNNG